MHKIRLLLLFGLLVTTTGRAEDTLKYVPIGLANSTCGQFTTAVEEGNFDSNWNRWNKYHSWLAGFLTGFNLLDEDTVDILGDSEFKDVMTYVENYCADNPLNLFVQAAQALLVELHPKKLSN